MTYDADTGNGATISLSSTSAIGSLQVEEMDAGEESLGDIEDSHLGTTGLKTYMPEDLAEGGELSGTAQFDQGTALSSTGTVETATLTFPLRSDHATPGTLVGTGYLKRIKRPSIANNAKMLVEFSFKWDGKTGPVHTPGSV